MYKKLIFLLLVTGLSLMSIVSSAFAGDALLSWDANNTDPDLAGYRVYYGATSGNYLQAKGEGVDVGNNLSYNFTNLTEGTTYYFSVTAYDKAGNESEYAGEVSKTILGTTPTWQQTLEQNFDIVDTFDEYQDWTGTTSTLASPGVTDPNDLPKYSDGSPSTIWKRYMYNPDGEVTGEGRLGPWISDHDSSYQVGSKGLKVSTRGYGPLEMQTYFGDGTPSSGYSEIFVFFRAYFPKNAFPTNTDPVDCGVNHGKVEYNQSVFDSTGYLYLTAWKFVNFGIGFTSVNNNPAAPNCYYGSGAGWISLTNTYFDTGEHPMYRPKIISDISSCFYEKDGCLSTNEECNGESAKTIGFDELGAIEVRLKTETYSGDSISQNGSIQIWWYDSNGIATEIFPNSPIAIVGSSYAGNLINRIIINGNKHRYETTGLPTNPPNYNCSVGEYRLGNGMAKFWYLDDFIIDDQRIGPKYFSLLSGTNTPPIAANQSLSLNEDASLDITLTAIDKEGNTLTYSVVANPTNGTLSGTAPYLKYTPNLNFYGSDSFTFKANDGKLDSNIATISLTINPVNDAPVLNSIADISVKEGEVITVTPSASDPDGDTLTYSVSGLPANADYDFDQKTGMLIWRTKDDEAGEYDLTFSVDDGKE